MGAKHLHRETAGQLQNRLQKYDIRDNSLVDQRVFYCLTNISHWIDDRFLLFTLGKSLWHGITSEGIENWL